MKRICFVLITLVMLCGFLITTGEAGQLCWNVDTINNDILDGYVSLMVSGGKWTRAVHGAYYGQGIILPVSGNMIKSPDGNNWFLQVGTVFTDAHIDIGATLNSSTLSGSARLVSVGVSNASYDMTFTSISCKNMPTP
jgi:hypothetical protein